MQDMMRQYGMGQDMGMFGSEGETLVLNAAHPLVQYLRSKVVVKDKNEEDAGKAETAAETVSAETAAAENTAAEAAAETAAAENVAAENAAETTAAETGKPSLTKQICNQLYDLARIQHGSLSPERMREFILRSSELMTALTR